MNIRRKIKTYTEAPLSHNIVMEALSSYGRPNDKISEMLKSGELLALRRGLYVPGPELDLPLPNNFLIANHLRGPSYISLESALSYWGLIPERVYEISSVTTKTSKTYETAIGRFSYLNAKFQIRVALFENSWQKANYFQCYILPQSLVCRSGCNCRCSCRSSWFWFYRTTDMQYHWRLLSVRIDGNILHDRTLTTVRGICYVYHTFLTW